MLSLIVAAVVCANEPSPPLAEVAAYLARAPKLGVSSLELSSYPPIDASSLFDKGTRAWGVVLIDGDQGNGNNASGFFNYLLAIFAVRDEQLELVATHPLGGTAFSRFVGDDGFHQSNSHSLLCPSVSGGVLQLIASCPGSGEPRDFGPGFERLCELARAGRCAKGGTKQDPRILAGAGRFVRRGDRFVPANAAKVIASLDTVRPWSDEKPNAAEVFISERPWAAKADEPVDWLELENRTTRWLDLAGLEIGGAWLTEVAARVEGACVVAPKGVVTLRRGRGPSWNARAQDCFFGDVALSGSLRFDGPRGTLAKSWDAGGMVSGYSLHCRPVGGCELARESPGARDVAR